MDPDPDPSIIKINNKKNLDFYCFVIFFWLFIFETPHQNVMDPQHWKKHTKERKKTYRAPEKEEQKSAGARVLHSILNKVHNGGAFELGKAPKAEVACRLEKVICYENTLRSIPTYARGLCK